MYNELDRQQKILDDQRKNSRWRFKDDPPTYEELVRKFREMPINET